eukprot:654715-Pleurochrysis_carterae.AAC.1
MRNIDGASFFLWKSTNKKEVRLTGRVLVHGHKRFLRDLAGAFFTDRLELFLTFGLEQEERRRLSAYSGAESAGARQVRLDEKEAARTERSAFLQLTQVAVVDDEFYELVASQ